MKIEVAWERELLRMKPREKLKPAYLYIYIYIRRSYYTEIAEVNNGEIKDSVAEREKRVPARNMLHFDFLPRRVYAISVGEL